MNYFQKNVHFKIQQIKKSHMTDEIKNKKQEIGTIGSQPPTTIRKI